MGKVAKDHIWETCLWETWGSSYCFHMGNCLWCFNFIDTSIAEFFLPTIPLLVLKMAPGMIVGGVNVWAPAVSSWGQERSGGCWMLTCRLLDVSTLSKACMKGPKAQAVKGLWSDYLCSVSHLSPCSMGLLRLSGADNWGEGDLGCLGNGISRAGS